MRFSLTIFKGLCGQYIFIMIRFMFLSYFFGSANQQPVKNYVCLTYLIQNNKHHVTNKIHCNNNIMTIVKKKYIIEQEN